MKRLNNLYYTVTLLTNITYAYSEVCQNLKSVARVNKLKEYKAIYINQIHKILINKNYIPGKYIHFTIREPKKREIISQSVTDKIINHLVSRFILQPALSSSLLTTNVASRLHLGTNAGINFFTKYANDCKTNYQKYYILKCDISSFFASINHDILKKKIIKKIKDKDAIKIIFDIIDSNSPGLCIGSMTSQILAIFYLNDLDHYIKETLKIKYYIRYQDDFLLFHPSKKYLNFCLKKIRIFLANEQLSLNKKTRIYKSSDNFLFLGRNRKGHYAKYRHIRKKLKKKLEQYKNKKVPLNSVASSYICYTNLNKKATQYMLPKNSSK